MTKAKTGPRNRKDHLLPRGYLNGFTKNGQLSVYDMVGKSWSENKPSEVGYIKGFFDYCPNSDPDQTADESFQFFENNFPQLRKQFVASKFSGWKDHLEFFLKYAQMLRVRTELFRKKTPRTLHLAQRKPNSTAATLCQI